MSDTLSTHSIVSCRIGASNDVVPIEFHCSADTAGARRWASAFRRIDAVELRHCGDRWTCAVSGVGNRLPVQRSVPLRIALGFAALGRPVFVFSEDR